MKRSVIRLFAIGVLLVLLWTSLADYRAGRDLADAGARIERILRGIDRDAAAQSSLTGAHASLQRAAPWRSSDPQWQLWRGLAQMLAGDAAAAEHGLRQAIAGGERAELTLNLGRALAARGDERGARQAFLRAAWASPAVTATLPASMRESLQREIAVLEQALRGGRLQTVPPLPR